MIELTGRKKLIVRAATTRARNAIKNADLSIEEVNAKLEKISKDLAPIFDDPKDVDTIMEDIAASFEAEDAIGALDAQTIAAVFENPALIDHVLHDAAPAESEA